MNIYLYKMKQELYTLPEGTLVKKNNCYYQKIGRKEKGISKNHDLIQKLVRKRYLQLVLTKLEDNEKLLSAVEEKFNLLKPAEIISAMPPSYQGFPLHYYFGIDDSNVHQSENPYKREKLIYKTNGGVYMRTKSEVIIGNFLEAHGIRYWYEAKFLLGGRWIYPDFLIENPNDHTVIPLEHLGMLGLPDYDERNKKKLKEYIDNDYFPGNNLICTYEQDIMEPGRLEAILHLFGIM